MKTIVVAYDKNFGIGANNDLLWQRNLPADLKHFKEVTAGNAIIMGFNTFKSIGRALPDRQNIVISHDSTPINGVTIVSDLQSAYGVVEAGRQPFIIGGGKIFSLAINEVDQIIATEVNADFSQATVFFPAIDLRIWREVSREKHLADEKNLYDYDFVTYVRR